ncbi:hypothetical protein HGM15179_013129 [Zosterops borbonicus]|uniref:Uncharacterized protein n=1 Tax=Zosterops borbonicus TaxID=364589 RepID=A0A8K1G8L7_9PASS|nr:hypothetical protein HGM15179_013129 [Zosterops borbonicus]
MFASLIGTPGLLKGDVQVWDLSKWENSSQARSAVEIHIAGMEELDVVTRLIPELYIRFVEDQLKTSKQTNDFMIHEKYLIDDDDGDKICYSKDRGKMTSLLVCLRFTTERPPTEVK